MALARSLAAALVGMVGFAGATVMPPRALAQVDSPSLSQPKDDMDHARALSRAFQSVAAKVSPSVVHITTFEKVRMVRRDFFGNVVEDLGEQKRQTGVGSGFVVSEEGHILTNNHVAGSADELVVRLADGREFPARLVGRDPSTDLAVLKIAGSDLRALELASAGDPRVGEWVLAIGSPFGLDSSVTAGIISATGRTGLSRDGSDRYEEFLQTDAAINPGNSGGPLVNLDGQVVGVNTQIASTSGGSVGIGFAIPADMARSVMEMIIRTGRAQRAWLGIDMERIAPGDPVLNKVPGRWAVRVSRVVEGSPAEKAGLKEGDLVLSIGDRPAQDNNRLRNAIAYTTPGQPTKVVVLRDGKMQALTAVLEDQFVGRTKAMGGTVIDVLGVAARTMDRTRSRELGYRSPIRGVEILDVVQDSPAERAGLRAGDIVLGIESDAVSSAEVLRSIAGSLDLRRTYELTVARGNSQWRIELGGQE